MLGKTWTENPLELVQGKGGGTVLGCGRGGLQGEGSGSAWVGEGEGGGKVPGEPSGRELGDAPLLVAWLGLGGIQGFVLGACEERISGV